MKDIYIDQGKQPKNGAELKRRIKTLNKEIAVDIKKEGIETGYILTHVMLIPFKYAAKYVEDNEGFEGLPNEKCIPVAGFLDYVG